MFAQPRRARASEPRRNFHAFAASYFRGFLCHLHATRRLTNPLGQKEVMLSEDNKTRALDRGEFLKRAGARTLQELATIHGFHLLLAHRSSSFDSVGAARC